MPASYSYDLRTKVLEAIDNEMSSTQVRDVFNISRNTINLWLKRREETEDYQAQEKYQKGYKPKVEDLENFRKFGRCYGSKT